MWQFLSTSPNWKFQNSLLYIYFLLLFFVILCTLTHPCSLPTKLQLGDHNFTSLPEFKLCNTSICFYPTPYSISVKQALSTFLFWLFSSSVFCWHAIFLLMFPLFLFCYIVELKLLMLFFSFFRKHIRDLLQEHFINIQVTCAYVECSACRNSVVWFVYFASLIAVSKLNGA